MQQREQAVLQHEQRLREWEEQLRQEQFEIQEKFQESTVFDESVPQSPLRDSMQSSPVRIAAVATPSMREQMTEEHPSAAQKTKLSQLMD